MRDERELGKRWQEEAQAKGQQGASLLAPGLEGFGCLGDRVRNRWETLRWGARSQRTYRPGREGFLFEEGWELVPGPGPVVTQFALSFHALYLQRSGAGSQDARREANCCNPAWIRKMVFGPWWLWR